MIDRYKIGILGTGRMADAFATSLDDINGVELYAVGSRSQDSARAFADKHNATHHYGSYQHLLEDDSVDVVYIATPHSFHHPHCMISLDAGKAVLCEKPFALNAVQAREMRDHAKARNCFLMEAMWTRFLPSIVKLRELLQGEVIGDIQLIVAGGAFMPSFDPENYLFNKDLGGGVLLDAGVYLVSVVSMILGRPAIIAAAATLGATGVDDNDAVLLSHTSGANALIYVSLKAKSSPDLRILGSRGEVHVHAPIFAPAKLSLRLYDDDEQVLDLPFVGNGYQYQLEEVVRCLRNGKLESDIMPLAETISVLETMDSIRHQIGLIYPQEK